MRGNECDSELRFTDAGTVVAAGGLFFAHCPANCPTMATPMPTPVSASKLLAVVTSPTKPDTLTSLLALE